MSKSPLVQWYDGEPWFDNPLLTIASNPKKRKVKKMARNAHRPRRANGRFMKLNKPRRAARSSHRPRRNVALNRRRSRRNPPNPPRRRSYRRNPPAVAAGPRIFGFQLPAIDAIVWTGAGFVAPKALTSIVMGFVPDAWKTNALVGWAARTVAALVPYIALRKMVSPRASNHFLVGAGTAFVLDLARTFAPGMIPGLDGYLPIPDHRFSAPARQQQQLVPFPRPRIQSDLPARLTPAQGF